MQHMRLMSNKVCALVILVDWCLLAIPSIGLFWASLGDFQTDNISMNDILNNSPFVMKVVVFFDICAWPCLVLLTIFANSLVVIARKQWRKIEAEIINLGIIPNNNPSNNNDQVHRPRRAYS